MSEKNDPKLKKVRQDADDKAGRDAITSSISMAFDNMQRVARDMGFPFPYLLDASQQVAKDYGAVCTPDFFGYNASGELQYRGRLDASRKETAPADARRDLFEAMSQVADTGRGPADQVPSMGCSIKWRD